METLVIGSLTQTGKKRAKNQPQSCSQYSLQYAWNVANINKFAIFENLNPLKLSAQGMGRTWEKFSSLPAKKPQKFETATGKENFYSNRGGSH